MSKIYNLLLFFFAVSAACALPAAAQTDKDAAPAPSSRLSDVALPAGALRVHDRSVPAEINETLGKLVALGGGRVRQGASELLIWDGGFRKSNRAQFVRKFAENLQSGGWTYAVAEENAEFTVFNSVNAGARRAAVGFWTANDDFLMLAWTEILPVDAPNAASVDTGVRRADAATRPKASDEAPKILNVEKNALWVNVMGDEMPAMPKFPALAAKPGKVRGYVKDWTGKPLANASIGVRSSYFAGYYAGGQGVTDRNGYYEITPPKGTAHIYNAGYQIAWGEGTAAVSLHPADGRLDGFTTADGAVENFVLLPYGVTSRENVQKNPRLASAYYGGSIYVHYYAAEAGDNRPMAGSLVEGSILEITLTPEDAAAGQPIVIRQPVGAGNVTLNNIPLVGRYRISARVGGKTLKLKENRRFDPLFGLSPGETVGEASVLLVPGETKPAMVAPAHGTWKSVSIDVSMP